MQLLHWKVIICGVDVCCCVVVLFAVVVWCCAVCCCVVVLLCCLLLCCCVVLLLCCLLFAAEGLVDCIWNVMAHAWKPDIVFWWNWWAHLNRRGASVHSTTGSRGVRISGSNAGYTMFRGAKGTGYPLHSPGSPSLPLPCIIVWHHISTGLHVLCDAVHDTERPLP